MFSFQLESMRNSKTSIQNRTGIFEPSKQSSVSYQSLWQFSRVIFKHGNAKHEIQLLLFQVQRQILEGRGYFPLTPSRVKMNFSLNFQMWGKKNQQFGKFLKSHFQWDILEKFEDIEQKKLNKLKSFKIPSFKMSSYVFSNWRIMSF